MRARIRFLRSLVALTSVILTVNAAQAQPGRGARASRGGNSNVWKYLAEKHDKNRDGKITKDEYTRADDTFARLDRNEDGILTPADWSGRSGPFGRGPGQRPGDGLRGTAPKKGAVAPDFELSQVTEPSKVVKLSSFAGVKPVALIFGSCT